MNGGNAAKAKATLRYGDHDDRISLRLARYDGGMGTNGLMLLIAAGIYIPLCLALIRRGHSFADMLFLCALILLPCLAVNAFHPPLGTTAFECIRMHSRRNGGWPWNFNYQGKLSTPSPARPVGISKRYHHRRPRVVVHSGFERL
jgi:hypothetical protein